MDINKVVSQVEALKQQRDHHKNELARIEALLARLNKALGSPSTPASGRQAQGKSRVYTNKYPQVCALPSCGKHYYAKKRWKPTEHVKHGPFCCPEHNSTFHTELVAKNREAARLGLTAPKPIPSRGVTLRPGDDLKAGR